MTRKGWSILQAILFFSALIGLIAMAYLMSEHSVAMEEFFNDKIWLLAVINLYFLTSIIIVIAAEMAKRRNETRLTLKSIFIGVSVLLMFFTYFWFTRGM